MVKIMDIIKKATGLEKRLTLLINNLCINQNLDRHDKTVIFQHLNAALNHIEESIKITEITDKIKE